MDSYLQIGDTVVLGSISERVGKALSVSDYEFYQTIRPRLLGIQMRVIKVLYQQTPARYTVQSPNEEFPVFSLPHEFFVRIDSTGLFNKYTVLRQGVKIDSCFVLRYDRDPAARIAMFAYAAAVEETNPRLAQEIREMLASIPAQQTT